MKPITLENQMSKKEKWMDFFGLLKMSQFEQTILNMIYENLEEAEKEIFREQVDTKNISFARRRSPIRDDVSYTCTEFHRKKIRGQTRVNWPLLSSKEQLKRGKNDYFYKGF